MMWLCIASTGESRLIRCANRQDSASYQSQVLTPTLNFLRHRTSSRRIREPIWFMQDGASSHTSASTQRFLTDNNVQVLDNWPPNSPDLNPVEHCWAWLAKRMVGRSFDTEDGLESAIREAWDARPDDLIPNLYASMDRRIAAVKAARGGATRY